LNNGRNPQCQANVISAVHNIPMADVAKLEGSKPTIGQSPFGIARGQTFEGALFRGDQIDNYCDSRASRVRSPHIGGCFLVLSIDRITT
jgi:hypothetical protein